MSPKLAIGLALFISGLATQLSGIESGWVNILTPKFVSGMLIQLSGFILSVWGGIETKPSRNGQRTRSEDIAHDVLVKKIEREIDKNEVLK